jgi:hypothetical protein
VERLGGSVFKLPEGEKLTVLDTFKGSEVVGIKYVVTFSLRLTPESSESIFQVI